MRRGKKIFLAVSLLGSLLGEIPLGHERAMILEARAQSRPSVPSSSSLSSMGKKSSKALPSKPLPSKPLPPSAEQKETIPSNTSSAPSPSSVSLLYQTHLLRLSEILGALTVLDSLCRSADSKEWAQQMEALSRAEMVFHPEYGPQLAGTYNESVRLYAFLHRACYPSTRRLIVHLMKEGESLTQSLKDRFGS